jgi:glycosyltransferase involved in cell wall biosynthesis
MKILLLSRYSNLGASSRLRFFQYIPYLQAESIEIDEVPFFSEDYLRSFYSLGHKSITQSLKAYIKRLIICIGYKHYDLVWIEKECFPWLPSIFEKLPFMRDCPYVLDYDDAIHHNYDKHDSSFVRIFLENKLNKLVSQATTVTVGNEYLANWARSLGADNVEIIPTVIDLERYPNPNFNSRLKNQAEFRIGWIGTPTSTNYLWSIQKILKKIAGKFPIRLVVIGSSSIEGFGVPLETHEWNSETEVSILSTLDVGIMPLTNSPWELGKCGYKLIQYMACGLPVISSSVGANKEIVEHGLNGFLVDSQSLWESSLQELFLNIDLRHSMGAAGRQKVEKQYCLQVTRQKLTALLKDAAYGVGGY